MSTCAMQAAAPALHAFLLEELGSNAGQLPRRAMCLLQACIDKSGAAFEPCALSDYKRATVARANADTVRAGTSQPAEQDAHDLDLLPGLAPQPLLTSSDYELLRTGHCYPSLPVQRPLHRWV
jgi:hypothetical protein